MPKWLQILLGSAAVLVIYGVLTAGGDRSICVITDAGTELCGKVKVLAWCDATETARSAFYDDPSALDMDTSSVDRAQLACDKLRAEDRP